MKYILTIALFIGSFSGTVVLAQNAEKTDSKKGVASFYATKFNGRKTATGEVFSNNNYTAASNHMPLNTWVKVTNLHNGKAVYVKVNDRMAANSGRMLDLTEQAARDLGYHDAGTTNVKMEVVPESEGRKHVLAQREAGGRTNKL